jgi:hypothetical protein
MAFVCAGALTAAQAPTQSPQQPGGNQPGATQSRPTTPQAGTMTLTGCLYQERDVPGQSPNVAERAGIGEDFILVEMPAGAQSQTGAAAGAQAGQTGAQAGQSTTAGRAGQVAGLATGRMWQIDDLDNDRLTPLAGKRVEVVGRAEDSEDARPGTAARQTPGETELPDFSATSIREVPGTCPATPPARSGAGSTTPSTPGAGQQQQR